MDEASAVAAAESAKVAGNEQFALGHYLPAVSRYSDGVRALQALADGASPAQPAPASVRSLLPALLCNRAFASLKAELYGDAIADAGAALAADPGYLKAYYRRGSAYLALARFALAKRDFSAVLRARPGDADAAAKLDACAKAMRRAAFEAAIASEATRPLAERLAVDTLTVDAAYAGPVLPAVPARGAGASAEACAADPAAVNEHGLSAGFVRALVADFRAQRVLHRKYALQLLLRAQALLVALPSLVHAPMPDGAAVFNVCGDTHGQFYDTLNIFALAGEPSPTNPYLFNGDFVDRGSFSVENVFTLLAYKLLYPAHVHLTRGNHETVNMNKMYGFEGEVKAKFDATVMEVFTEVFRALPLAAVIDRKVIVLHGGLFQRGGVTLEDIAKIQRVREPPEDGLMSDILWSDPQPFPGRGPSKRGVGQSFGPDITADFLDANGLQLLIRSHEVMEEGYQVIHNGRLITVFSAPNYCDAMGNKGAVVRLDRDCKPAFLAFDAVPHPPVRPMAYAAGMMSQYGV